MKFNISIQTDHNYYILYNVVANTIDKAHNIATNLTAAIDSLILTPIELHSN